MTTMRGVRKAATLILAAKSTIRSSGNGGADVVPDCYKILGLERSKGSRHMPSAYVFPGGAVDRADFSPRWLEVFQRRGSSWLSDMELITARTAVPRPSTLLPTEYTEWADGVSQTLPPETALRLTAIRETFEECGILLVRSNSSSASSLNDPAVSLQTQLSTDELVIWQDRVRSNPLELADLCLERNCCPDVWSLHEWCDWLTPVSLSNRFDTLFYICEVASELAVHCSFDEIADHEWATPDEFLDLFRTRRFYLPPPQVYELSRLRTLMETGYLKRFFKQSIHPAIPFMYPVVAAAKDGSLFLYPGDELYPENGDESTVLEFENQTLDDLMRSSRRLHRAFSAHTKEFTLICNLEGDPESNSSKLHFVSRL